MNSSTSGSTKVIWAVVAIVVVILIVWGFMSSSKNTSMVASSTAATTTAGGQVAGTNAAPTQLDTFVSNTNNVQQLLNSAKVRVPGTALDVALVNGKATYGSGTTKGTFTINKILGVVKVQSDVTAAATSSYDVFADITMTTGSTTAVARTGIFQVTLNSATLTSSVVVGQNVIVSGLLVGDVGPTDQTYAFSSTGMRYAPITYTVAVHYLDRKNGEAPTTTPSLAKDVQFHVKNHIISQ